MAVIDPDGLFNGNRMRKLSVMARLYWPYFLLASNGYARLEINYHRIVSRAFPTFKPPPTEAEVNGYLKEYADAHLLFLYLFGGQMWGQFDCPERLQDKYKKAACKRSPEPPAKEYREWKQRYEAEKKAVSGIVAILPESSPKVAEVFVQLSPLGNEIENVNENGKSKPPASQAKSDVRFKPVKDFVSKCCEHAKVPFTWDGSESSHLSKWLKANPELNTDAVIGLVRVRFRSGAPPGDRPRIWIGNLGKYATERVNGTATKAQQRQSNSAKAISSVFGIPVDVGRGELSDGDNSADGRTLEGTLEIVPSG